MPTGTARVFASAVADDLAANERQEAYRKLRAIAHIPGIQFARVEAQSRHLRRIAGRIIDR